MTKPEKSISDQEMANQAVALLEKLDNMPVDDKLAILNTAIGMVNARIQSQVLVAALRNVMNPQ